MVDPVNGNAQAIDALERALSHVRGGNVGYALVTIIETFQTAPRAVKGHTGGAGHLDSFAINALREHADELERRELNFTLPERNPLLGADSVCYNAARGTLSYDFITWLVDAEMTRIREGAPAPLKVGFFWGRDGKAGFGTPKREQFFHHVVKPALALIGAVEDPVAADGRCKPTYVLRDVVAAARRGEAVPAFHASEIATAHVRQMLAPIEPQKPVVITLREADHWPTRNSNIKAWLGFAEYLWARQQPVIFVRDTAKADESLPSAWTCPEASRSLDMRMALYASAKVNLFTSNGPWSLALFSDRPWLMFTRVGDDNDPYRPNTPTFWRESHGVSVGDQFPWARPDQRLVWAADDYENLVAAWDELAPHLAQAA